MSIREYGIVRNRGNKEGCKPTAVAMICRKYVLFSPLESASAASGTDVTERQCLCRHFRVLSLGAEY